MPLSYPPSRWANISLDFRLLWKWLKDATDAINAGGGAATPRTIVRTTFAAADLSKAVTWTPVGGSGYNIVGLVAIDAGGDSPPLVTFVPTDDGHATLVPSDNFTTDGSLIVFEVVKIP